MNAITPSFPASPQEQAAWYWLQQHRHQPEQHPDPAFLDWLAADPKHPQLYAQAEILWGLTDDPARRLAEEEADILAGYLARSRVPIQRHLPRWSRMALAASVVLSLWIGATQHPSEWLDSLNADQVTGVAEIRSIQLADGTQLTLDARTALNIEVTPQKRHIELLRGAIWLHVTPNADLPFRVATDQGEVEVLGTEFEVRRLEDSTRVTLASGKVAVRSHQNGVALVLNPEQQITLNDGGIIGAPHKVDSRAQSSWTQGWLTFYQTPLHEVLSRLAPYHSGSIVLLNSSLANRPISASFPGASPEQALNSLQAVVGFQQQALPGGLIMIY